MKRQRKAIVALLKTAAVLAVDPTSPVINTKTIKRVAQKHLACYAKRCIPKYVLDVHKQVKHKTKQRRRINSIIFWNINLFPRHDLNVYAFLMSHNPMPIPQVKNCRNPKPRLQRETYHLTSEAGNLWSSRKFLRTPLSLHPKQQYPRKKHCSGRLRLIPAKRLRKFSERKRTEEPFSNSGDSDTLKLNCCLSGVTHNAYVPMGSWKCTRRHAVDEERPRNARGTPEEGLHGG